MAKAKPVLFVWDTTVSDSPTIQKRKTVHRLFSVYKKHCIKTAYIQALHVFSLFVTTEHVYCSWAFNEGYSCYVNSSLMFLLAFTGKHHCSGFVFPCCLLYSNSEKQNQLCNIHHCYFICIFCCCFFDVNVSSFLLSYVHLLLMNFVYFVDMRDSIALIWLMRCSQHSLIVVYVVYFLLHMLKCMVVYLLMYITFILTDCLSDI